ncbi:MAG: PleD family two-component system response regulator [Myxococcota bacterium]|nr:hypothetical protein [Spirochaeta sp.]RPG09027.1 MAG: response regulator [Proteobacteria bacterium TMED72]
MAKTILLADDSLVIQKLVGLSFANEDVEIVSTDNGTEAIQMAGILHPDLVLADVVMPGLSGYEVCRAIKSQPELSDIPVILLTRTSESFNEDLAHQIGADGYITKPFESQTLAARVHEILSRSDAKSSIPAPMDDPAAIADPFEKSGDTAILAQTTNHELLMEPLTPDEFRNGVEPEKEEDNLSSLMDPDWDPTNQPGVSQKNLEAPFSGGTDRWLDDDADAVIETLLQDETKSEIDPTDSRAKISQAVEKMDWQAFSDLPEALAEKIVERVEAIAWEVIPQMAETLIREEIQRMKGGAQDKD